MTTITPVSIERPQQLAQLLNGIQHSVREYKLDCGRDVYDRKGATHRIEAYRIKGGFRFRLDGAPSGRDATPPEPTFVEQLIQILTGRRDVWVMPEVKGTL